MTLIRDIIQDHIINKLDVSLSIVAVGSVSEGKQSVTFCNIKWLKLYESVNVAQLVYMVDSINGNTVIFNIPTGAPAFTLNTVPTLNRPLLFDGTLSNTKFEWAKFDNSERNKLPFIWLVSPTETQTDNIQGSGTKTAVLKLWFIHWSDWSKLNADRQNEAVRPLYALVKEFTKTINRISYVFEGYDTAIDRDFPKLATRGENGGEATLFDSTLSGVELDINVKIFHRYCENC